MKTFFAAKKPTLNEINEYCKGELICSGISGDETVSALCTDSREADRDTMFAAIVGERTDGHE